MTKAGSSDYYTRLIKESPHVYGDHGIPPEELSMENSELNDPQLIKAGQDFVEGNFYSVMLAHLISLMWVLTFKCGREVLLRAGYSHNVDNSLPRYLSTVLHITMWYENDTVEPTAKGNQDLNRVRKLHGAAAKTYFKVKSPSLPALSDRQEKILEAVRKITADIDSSKWPADILPASPDVPMSQFAMVITQFCFIGFPVLFPETYGIKDRKGMDGFVHLWAIIGRQLGIEDQFNLALQYKRTNGELADFRKIYHNIFLPNLKETDATAVLMWDALLEGINKYIPTLNPMAAIKFMLSQAVGSKAAEVMKPLMSWNDWWYDRVLLFATNGWPMNWESLRDKRNKDIRRFIQQGQNKYLMNWSSILRKILKFYGVAELDNILSSGVLLDTLPGIPMEF